MEERIRRDIWYIENWSFWLDIKIIFMTAKSIICPDKNAYQEYIKRKRGCSISLENSWRTTADQHMHISCCACAYQLLCKRTTAVVRPEILTVTTTYTNFPNNIYQLFQQHILAFPTTYPSSFNNISQFFQQQEEGVSSTYDTSSFQIFSLLITQITQTEAC